MALTIQDPEAERMARELAQRSGRPLDEAVGAAIRKAWESAEAPPRPLDPDRKAELFERIRAIQRRVAALPDLDTRDADEILGYSKGGGRSGNLERRGL